MPRPFGSSDYTFTNPISPLLAWAGGKRHLVKALLRFLPRDLDQGEYHEPFLGAASLFFAVQPERAVLSDANHHLVRCYEFVRDNPDRVADCLARHAARSSKDYYYRTRDEYNRLRFSAAQAARFIYLNKACFNGIFRVNRADEFNVPYGWKERVVLPDRALVRRVSEAFKRANLRAVPFEEALETVQSGDFVYLDPPYPPLNGTSFFRHYTADLFDMRDHERLAKLMKSMDAKGCRLLLSNADTDSIRSHQQTNYCTLQSLQNQAFMENMCRFHNTLVARKMRFNSSPRHRLLSFPEGGVGDRGCYPTGGVRGRGCFPERRA